MPRSIPTKAIHKANELWATFHVPETAIDLSEASDTETNEVTHFANFAFVSRIYADIIRWEYANDVRYERKIGKEAIVHGKHLIVIPYASRVTEVSATPHAVANDTYISDYFVVNIADCVINLDVSHCAMGISDITIDQRNEGMMAKVYDSKGELIFDGTTQSNGVYHLKCYCEGDEFFNRSGEHWIWYKVG